MLNYEYNFSGKKIEVGGPAMPLEIKYPLMYEKLKESVEFRRECGEYLTEILKLHNYWKDVVPTPQKVIDALIREGST